MDLSNEQISLESLSKALVGLSEQSMSYRREAHDRDYLQAFYEEHAREGRPSDANTVRMEREYLRAYAVFDQEAV